MAIFYKHFYNAGTVFYAFLVCFLLSANLAMASNPLFTVEDVRVDITAENALKARDQAFEEAQGQAFEVLAQRMLSEMELKFFEIPDVLEIAPLIQDYEITQEKLSQVRYMGRYTFRFKDEAVRRFFAKTGVEYTDISSKPLLILPFYQNDRDMQLWSPYNIWMKAWARLESLGTLVPIIVPIGDLSDVRSINDNEALTYDDKRLNEMLARYDAGEALLAIAVPNEALLQVSTPDSEARGALSVNIYRTDRAGPEHVLQIVIEARTGETRAKMFDRAALNVQKALQKDWKTKTLVTSGQGGRLQARISFESLQEWADTQRALERVYGVAEVSLKSLSPKEALVDLVFQGTERRLHLALEQADIILSTPRINFSSFERPSLNIGAPLVYELKLKKYNLSRMDKVL